jgi:hypothetical protein
MRWFKHLSNASEDEKLSEILDLFGAEGYGIYWIICEKIAFLMDKTPRTSARYSVKKWSKFCGKSPKVLRKFLETFQELSLFKIEICKKNSDFLIIECPNLLKYRDEYSKKSSQAPDNIQSESGECPDQDTDTEAEAETELVNSNDPNPNKGKTEAPDFESFKTTESFKKWAKQKNINEDQIKKYIEECLIWHGAKGTRYKNWNKTIQNWILKDLKNKPVTSNGLEELLKNGQ